MSSIQSSSSSAVRATWCDLVRHQLSRAVVLFFDCELESVADSDTFPSVYREKVARLNFLIRKRLLLVGKAKVLELYDALFDKCVQTPLVRVARSLEIELPEARKPRAKSKPTSESTVSPPTTLALGNSTKLGGNETSTTSGCTNVANEVSSASVSGDTESLPEDTGTPTSRESEPALVSEEGSESSNNHPASHTNTTEQAVIEIPSAVGDAATTSILANKTVSSPQASEDRAEPTEVPHVVSENATRGLETRTSVALEDVESRDPAPTATSQADDPEGLEDNEPKTPSAVDEPTSLEPTAPASSESEQPLAKTPTTTADAAVDTTHQTPKGSDDSPPEKGSESSLFWVLLSCVAVLALGFLLVLAGDRIKRSAYQYLPLVDLDSEESLDSYQVTPVLASSHEEPSAVAELVDETLMSPPSSPRGPGNRVS